jgi:hypothetical protein
VQLLWLVFGATFTGGRALINALIPSNGLSHHSAPYDFTPFAPEVQKILQKLHLLRDGISIEPIIRKIVAWTSPSEQLFYVTFIYLLMLTDFFRRGRAGA